MHFLFMSVCLSADLGLELAESQERIADFRALKMKMSEELGNLTVGTELVKGLFGRSKSVFLNVVRLFHAKIASPHKSAAKLKILQSSPLTSFSSHCQGIAAYAGMFAMEGLE